MAILGSKAVLLSAADRAAVCGAGQAAQQGLVGPEQDAALSQHGPHGPHVVLPLADPHAFLDTHGHKLGAHIRNIRNIAAPVRPSMTPVLLGPLNRVPVRTNYGHV